MAGFYFKRDGIGLAALARINPHAALAQQQLETVQRIRQEARAMYGPEASPVVEHALAARIAELEGFLDAMRQAHDEVEARVATLEGQLARQARRQAEGPRVVPPVEAPPAVKPPVVKPPVVKPVAPEPARQFFRQAEAGEFERRRAAREAERQAHREAAERRRVVRAAAREQRRAEELARLNATAAEKAQIERRRLLAARAQFSLTDEDAWRQAGPTWYGRPRASVARELEVVEERPTRCEACGGRDLTWNGDAWWCNGCDEAAYVDRLEYHDLGAFPGTDAGYAVASGAHDDGDRFYLEATALYHDTAVMNWPHGRIRTRVRRWNEGKPRPEAYGWRARRRAWRA